jgi:hypothetical protein
MSARFFTLGLLLSVLALAGCETRKACDYTAFRAHQPRSIVVLPPLNQSTDIKGTYSYLSTVTYPLAEMGYYVFPVAEVDQLLKDNGLPTAGEMHQVPLNKIGEVIGADSVLYVTLKQYGSKYEVISSVTTVSADAKLVDVKTGVTLWEGSATAQQSSSGGDPIAALINAALTQIVSSATDSAHEVSSMANAQLFLPKDYGLLHGPYFPKEKEQ